MVREREGEREIGRDEEWKKPIDLISVDPWAEDSSRICIILATKTLLNDVIKLPMFVSDACFYLPSELFITQRQHIVQHKSVQKHKRKS